MTMDQTWHFSYGNVTELWIVVCSTSSVSEAE